MPLPARLIATMRVKLSIKPSSTPRSHPCAGRRIRLAAQQSVGPRAPMKSGSKTSTAASADRQSTAAALFTAEEASDLAAPPSGAETVFYTHTLCPYAERVWITLLEKGVPHRLVHIDLSRKPAWYRKINPRGLVPALQHGGQVHVESADICRYIDSCAAGPSLTPVDPALKREMEALLKGPCSGAVSAGLALMAGSGRHWGIGSGQSAGQRAAFEEQLRGLDASLQRHGGPFLLGDQPSLADIMVYPFIRRFDVAKPLSGYDVSAALGGSIGRWLAAMDARPSCSTTAANSRLLLQAFKEHRSLDFFDYDSYSCCQLHPHINSFLR